MAQAYYNTLTTLRNYIAQIQNAMDNMDLDGEQSMSTWATQLTNLVNSLNGQISADDSDFSNIYDAIVAKGQSPDEEDRDTYAPAIMAISGGGGSNLQTLNVTPSTTQQTLTPTSPVDGWDEVIVAAIGLQNKTVTPSSSQQSISADQGYDGLGTVTVDAVNLQNKTVTPSTSQQTVQCDNNYAGLGTVTVDAVDNSIDANIQQGNIKSGVTILGVTGNYTGGGSNYQQKTVTPSASQQVISADSGYDALSQVTINGSSNLAAGNIKKDVEIFGVTGSYEGAGVTIDPHPTNLQYACTDGSSYASLLPKDGSWTPLIDLTGITSTNNMRYMFNNNTVVTDLDLTGWTIPDIAVACTSMFNGCSSLQYIRGSLSFAKSTNFTSMFANCSSLIQVGIKNFGFSATSNTLTLDLSASAVLDAATLVSGMDTNSSGKTRIIKLNATVYNNLSQATIDAAAAKNITLQSA